MQSTVLELIAGAAIAILITIWIEWLRKPRLALTTATPSDPTYESRDRPALAARFLGVDVGNMSLPRLGRWMQRSAALQCHGSVTFHHLDGQNVFGRSMPIRWSGSPEPVPMQIAIGTNRILIADPSRFTLEPRIDIYPGESQRLDIAAKFDDEPDSYGWSNESYFSQPVWRNPAWRLPSARYLVQVVVMSSGERRIALFRLAADVARRDFRLEPALEGDKVRD